MMASWLLVILTLVVNVTLIASKDNRTEIVIFTISNIDDGVGDSVAVVGAQWIAVQEINNDKSLLSNYRLNLTGKNYINTPICSTNMITFYTYSQYIKQYLTLNKVPN